MHIWGTRWRWVNLVISPQEGQVMRKTLPFHIVIMSSDSFGPICLSQVEKIRMIHCAQLLRWMNPVPITWIEGSSKIHTLYLKRKKKKRNNHTLVRTVLCGPVIVIYFPIFFTAMFYTSPALIERGDDWYMYILVNSLAPTQIDRVQRHIIRGTQPQWIKDRTQHKILGCYVCSRSIPPQFVRQNIAVERMTNFQVI